MSFRLLFIALLGTQILAAQDLEAVSKNESQNEETAFQAAVRDGLRSADTYSASVFVLNHDTTAIPILVRAIKENLDGKNALQFVSRATELIAYAASDRGMDAIAELCSVDQERFAPYVERLLNHAINRNREYEIVYHTLEAESHIREFVVRWLKDSLEFPQSDVALAKEVLRRERIGHSISDNDAVIASLPVATRERVFRAIEKVRTDEREREEKKQ